MELAEYFLDKPRGSKAKMADELGITRTWLALIISKRRKPSIGLALQIEAATRKKVSRKKLLPEIFFGK